MTTKTNQTRLLVILAVLLIVFSVIAFVVPFQKTAVFWLAYLFGLVSICAQAYVQRIAFSKGESARSKFYGFPIARIGVAYLVVQLGLSILFMALAVIVPTWVAVVLFILLLAAAVVGFVAADAMRDEVQRQDVQLKKDVAVMQDMVIVRLSQKDTLSFRASCHTVQMQIRYVFSDGTADASDIMEAEVGEVLKDGEIAYV